MKKVIVETSGSFSLVDFTVPQEILNGRPVVVEVTHFVSQRISSGQLTVLKGSLPEEACDADFLAHFEACDRDAVLALASYLSEPVEDEPKPTRGRKASK